MAVAYCDVVNLQTKARPGIYWDEHNFERECVIIEVSCDRYTKRLNAIDIRTGERILDPPSAIPVARKSPPPPGGLSALRNG